MTSTLAISDTYDDVERLILSTCHRFQRRFGGDFDDLASEANFAFLRAYETFDESKGFEFSTYLVTVIWNRLTDLSYYEDRRKGIRGMSIDCENEEGNRYSGLIEDKSVAKFAREEFYEHLSADAQMVARLTLDSPKEIADIAMAKGNEDRNWRSTIRNYLYDLGWSAGRIAESFNEIRLSFS